MDCIELSLKKLEDESKLLAESIKKEYQPDLIIFIARGGYLIAKTISEVLNMPLTGITAERKGNSLKNLVSPILPYIPRSICNLLRKAEIKSDYHKSHTERNVKLLEKDFDLSKFHKILVVDDSVDTGMSMLAVMNEIKKVAPQAIIKTAAINVLSGSTDIIKIDFWNYKDIVMRTPMSKDSKEYMVFNKLYKQNFRC